MKLFLLAGIWGNSFILILGIFCSGIAYAFSYKLLSDVGPTGALTVCFFILFGTGLVLLKLKSFQFFLFRRVK